MGDRGESDRDDTAWEVKKFTGNGRLRVKRILKNIRKHLAALFSLGKWEKFVLVCVQEHRLEFQFRIADIVACIERKYGIQNHGGHLNRKIFDAVRRLVNRKVVVKKGRGVYALRKDLARISALGYPLVGEAVFPPLKDTEKCHKAFRKAVKSHVTSSSKNKENLSAAARHGSGVGGDSTITSITCNSDITDSNTGGSTDSSTSISSDGVGTPNIVGSGFVIRAHVINPRGGWVGYYISVSVAYYVLSFVKGLIREHLMELYDESFIRKLDQSIETVAGALPNAEFTVGCHGQYGGSLNGFSPLIPRCGGHSYEYGIDIFLPADLSDVLRDVSFTKIYIKKLRGAFHE